MNLLHPAAAALLLAAGLAQAGGDDWRHTVRPGDTLIAIGREMLERPGDWARLQRLNRIADPRRLRPGATLRIPVALLRREPATARVAAAHGHVRSGAGAVAAGMTVGRGDVLTTGEQSFVTLELSDGSRLTLQPGSRLRVQEMATRRGTALADTRLHLDGGRLESLVRRALGPRPHYVVSTPGATIGVRGTRFRVATDGGASRAEVTEGRVGVGGGRDAVEVPAGYGLALAAGARPGTPAALLPPPRLEGLPLIQDRIVVRITLPPVAGATAYRVQMATDPELRQVVAESVVAEPVAKFADLADGDYTVRARAIDARGLEGQDAQFSFRLKARPEPPFAASPVAGAKLRGDTAELSWAVAPQAARYQVQLASEPDFARPLAESQPVADQRLVPVARLAPGDYYWRARSLRADGDAGPWGDAQRFVLRPPPATPEPPAIGDEELRFAWPAEPGQVFLFQFARDEGFAHLLAERRLEAPTATVPRPAPGTYFMRVRATDPDGFVGPFTGTQRIEVPSPPPPWWLLLVLLPLL